MLKLCRVTKVNVLFLVLVYVLILANFNLFEFSAAILEKGVLFAIYTEIKDLRCNHCCSLQLSLERLARILIDMLAI